MKKLLLSTYIILLFTPFVFAQSAAEKLMEEAVQLAEIPKYDLSNSKWQAAADIFKKEGDYSMYAKCMAEKGKNLLDNGKDSDALNVLNSLIDESEKAIKKPDVSLALAYKYKGYVYYNADDLVNAAPAFKKALEIREAVDPANIDLFRDHFNLGVIYRNLNNLIDAKKFHLSAIALYEKNAQPHILSKMYVSLSMTLDQMGNSAEAQDYLDIAIQLAEDHYGKDSPMLASPYLQKGDLLKSVASSPEILKSALSAYKIALALFEKMENPDYYNQSVCLSQIGNIYFLGTEYFDTEQKEINAAKTALTYYEKALEINQKHQPKSIIHLLSILNIAKAQGRIKDFDKANAFANQALEMAEAILPAKHVTKAEVFQVFAEINTKQKNYKGAISYYDRAIQAMMLGDTKLDAVGLPKWESVQNEKILSLQKLKELLAFKSRILVEDYKISNNKALLTTALELVKFCDQIVDKLRADYAAEGSKLALSDMTIDVYENAIEICLALAKANNDNSFKEKAYYYSEKSKGLLLLEAFQSSKASKMAGLSDAVIQEEAALRLAISDLKQQIFQLKGRGEGDSEEAKNLEKQTFEKKQAYTAFTKKIEKEHPAYYSAKFEIQLLDVGQTRAMLKKDQALLEYFVGDKHIFVFKITPDAYEVYDLPNKATFVQEVKAFRQSIYGYYLDESNRSDELYEKYAKEYAKAAYEMYTSIIAPLGELPRRLIIVPAGPLANVPFEPMLKENPSDAKQYQSHKYMGRDHIISYNYSATLLNEMRNRTHDSKRETFLAFAPSFGTDAASSVRGKRFALAPLNFNTSEVENVRKSLGKGTVLLGNDATEENFKKMGSNYQIVHFATHGMANDRDPDFSLLAFTEIPDSIENEFVYVSDLYNMKLNADLVVLSACETGLGEMRKGEGVISLARGFSYAGAKSIFTTLWSVNDQATSNIVESFYKYLKEGKDKDEALHLAKMDFINEGNNMTSHPFLWSPYIFIGDTAPLDLGAKIPWLYIAIGVGAIALLAIAFKLMKGNSKKEAA